MLKRETRDAFSSRCSTLTIQLSHHWMIWLNSPSSARTPSGATAESQPWALQPQSFRVSGFLSRFLLPPFRGKRNTGRIPPACAPSGALHSAHVPRVPLARVQPASSMSKPSGFNRAAAVEHFVVVGDDKAVRVTTGKARARTIEAINRAVATPSVLPEHGMRYRVPWVLDRRHAVRDGGRADRAVRPLSPRASEPSGPF